MGDLTLPLPAAGSSPGALTGRLDTARLRVAGDGRLTRLAQAGDTRAFEAIFERHHQALYRYCASIVRSPEDAADALQSTMLKAMLALPAKRAEVVLKPWLYRIAHNEAVSILRRRRVHEEITEATGPVTQGTEADATRRARLRELLSDLDDLPERQRGAVVMRELNGLEFTDIGLAFGISPAAAKQAVYEARVALHERSEGRDMSCEAIRKALSDGDGRITRGRRIRSHLGDCAGCHDFKEAIEARRGDLAALAPPIEVAAAATILHGLIGGGGGGTGGGLGGGLAAGIGKLGAASGVLKSGAVGASLVVAGAASLAAGGGPSIDPGAGSAPAAKSRTEVMRSAIVNRLASGTIPVLVPIAALEPLTDLTDLRTNTRRDKSSPATREAPLVAALREQRGGEDDGGTATTEVQVSDPPVDRPALTVAAPRVAVGVPRLPTGTPRLPIAEALPSPLGASPGTPGATGVEAPEVGLSVPPVTLPPVDIPAAGGELPK